MGPNTEIVVKLHGRQLTVDGREVVLRKQIAQKLSRIRWRIGGGGSSAYHLPMEEAGVRLGEVPVAVAFEPTYTVAISGVALTQVTTPRQTVTGVVEVVDESTGNYVQPGAVPLSQRAAKAWVWVTEDRKDQTRRLVFVAIQPEQLHSRLMMWVRVGNQIADARSWHERSSSTHDANGHDCTIQLRMDRVRKRFPDAVHVDLIVRPSVEEAETSTSNIPTWLGEWLFRDIPLDADPQDIENRRQDGYPKSLVPAESRSLTLEEAEQPPR